MYFLAALVRVCVDVICVSHDMNRCSVWWLVCSVNIKNLRNASFKLTFYECVVSVCGVGFACLWCSLR